MTERQHLAYDPCRPPPLSDIEKIRNAPSKISVSQITRWNTCRRKWHLSAVHGLRTPSGPEADLGNRIHDALEKYVREGVPLPENDPELASARRAVVRGLIAQPRDPNVQCELEFDIPSGVPGVNFLGYIDVFSDDGRTREVTDYKSKKNAKYALTTTALRSDLQMNIYAHAGEQLYGPRSHTKIRHVVLLTTPPFDAFPVPALVSREEVADHVAMVRKHRLLPMLEDSQKTWLDVEPAPSQCWQYRRPCEFAPLCFPGFGKPDPFQDDGSLDFRTASSVDTNNPFNGREPQPLNPFAHKPPTILPPELQMNLTDMLNKERATTKAPEPALPASEVVTGSLADALRLGSAKDVTPPKAELAAPVTSADIPKVAVPDKAEQPAMQVVTESDEKAKAKPARKDDPMGQIPKRVKMVLVDVFIQASEGRLQQVNGNELAVLLNREVCEAHSKKHGVPVADCRLIPFGQGTAELASLAMTRLDKGEFDNALVTLSTQDPLQLPLIGLFAAHAKQVFRGR